MMLTFCIITRMIEQSENFQNPVGYGNIIFTWWGQMSGLCISNVYMQIDEV